MLDRTRHGAVDLLSGRDPLNQENAEGMARTVDEVLKAGQPRLVLDLSLIPFMDSTGLEWLLDLRDRCRLRGGAFKLAAPNSLCRDVLRITGLDHQFEIFDEPMKAVGSFAQ